MKIAAILLSSLALLFGACQRTETVSEDVNEQVTESITPSAADTAAAPSVSSDAPAAPPATPELPQLAPEGVFFLLVAKSVQSPDGIIGFPAGTEVRKQKDGSFFVGSHKMQLLGHEVTNDLRVVRQIAAAAHAAQAARAAQAAAHEKALREAAAKAAKAAAAQPKAAPRRATPSHLAAGPPPPTKPPLGSSSSMGAAHERVKDGYYWKRNSDGEWEIVRPVK